MATALEAQLSTTTSSLWCKHLPVRLAGVFSTAKTKTFEPISGQHPACQCWVNAHAYTPLARSRQSLGRHLFRLGLCTLPGRSYWCAESTWRYRSPQSEQNSDKQKRHLGKPWLNEQGQILPTRSWNKVYLADLILIDEQQQKLSVNGTNATPEKSSIQCHPSRSPCPLRLAARWPT